MANPQLWSGVSLSVQSALAATKTISAITKANPGVATSTSHGYTNGQEISLDILGMHQLDDRVIRVANVAANTFELDGVDTTLMDTFASGTAALITFGLTVTTITGSTTSGGDFDRIDITTIHDTVRREIAGASTPITFSLESFWDPADTGLIGLKSASDVKGVRAIRFVFPSGYRFYTQGYVSCTMAPTGTAQGLVTTPVVITSNGRLTSYST
jgi:hypothetical protein